MYPFHKLSKKLLDSIIVRQLAIDLLPADVVPETVVQTAELPTFYVFRKVCTMLVSVFSPVYYAVSQVL
jgi:hypothetical protein